MNPALDVVKLGLVEIIDIRFEHWEQIKTIYTQGIATGNATFQAEPPDWEEWNSSHLANCRIVAVENGKVCGWAALSPVSSRCVYSGVAEVSIYVGKDHRGKQVGSHLLQQLISMSEEAGPMDTPGRYFS